MHMRFKLRNPEDGLLHTYEAEFSDPPPMKMERGSIKRLVVVRGRPGIFRVERTLPKRIVLTAANDLSMAWIGDRQVKIRNGRVSPFYG